MKKQTPSHLEDLPIVGPCHLPREGLDETPKTVHCGHCDKPVHNLSRMTRAEAGELLNGEGPSPCVSYEADPETGLIVYADEDPQKPGPSRLRWVIMAAAVGAVGAGVAHQVPHANAEAKVSSVMHTVKSQLAQMQSAKSAGEAQLPGGGLVSPSMMGLSGQSAGGETLGESIESALASLELYNNGLNGSGTGTEAVPTPSEIETPSHLTAPLVPAPEHINLAVPAEPERMFLRGDVAYVPPVSADPTAHTAGPAEPEAKDPACVETEEFRSCDHNPNAEQEQKRPLRRGKIKRPH
ncbi:MAG: hypothetical protein ACE366_23285 [Bradymonadia bacterium]